MIALFVALPRLVQQQRNRDVIATTYLINTTQLPSL